MAEVGASVAAGESAGAVAGAEVVAEAVGYLIDAAAVVEEVAGLGVADEAAHGEVVVEVGEQVADLVGADGDAGGDFAGVVGEAEDGGQVDEDVEVGADAGA